jgi:hypothetical protein
MSLSMASGACASTSEASANTSLPSQKHEIYLGAANPGADSRSAVSAGIFAGIFAFVRSPQILAVSPADFSPCLRVQKFRSSRPVFDGRNAF